jgi:predicted nucleotidyltransferase
MGDIWEIMKMRLIEAEQKAILASVIKFDGDAEVYLFGSRVDYARKGGDLDILVRSDVLKNSMLHLLEDELFKYIDEQKVDFVLTGRSSLSSFASMVLEKGAVKLCQKKS